VFFAQSASKECVVGGHVSLNVSGVIFILMKYDIQGLL